MPGFLKISEAASLAVHAMAYLTQQSGKLTSTHEIAQILKVSEAHLAKVMQRLEHAGLIKSKRGPNGGFCLHQPAAQITLNNIYEVIEGPHQPLFCLLGHPVCNDKCPLGDMMRSVEKQMETVLSSKTLADLEVRFEFKASKEA